MQESKHTRMVGDPLGCLPRTNIVHFVLDVRIWDVPMASAIAYKQICINTNQYKCILNHFMTIQTKYIPNTSYKLINTNHESRYEYTPIKANTNTSQYKYKPIQTTLIQTDTNHWNHQHQEQIGPGQRTQRRAPAALRTSNLYMDETLEVLHARETELPCSVDLVIDHLCPVHFAQNKLFSNRKEKKQKRWINSYCNLQIVFSP